MDIYKYQTIDKFFWKNLRCSSLWFQSPINFDDEFDSNLPLDINYSYLEIETFLRASYLHINNTQDGFESSMMHEVNKLNEDKDYQKKFFQGLINEHSEQRIGITCFSKTEDNRKLWAMYADKGRGVCFRFNSINDIEFFDSLAPVKYVKPLPRIKMDFFDLPDCLKEFYTNKHITWCDQEEIRLFQQKPNSYRYKNESLKEIIFGSRVKKKDIQKIISMALINNSGTEFTQMTTKNGEYIKVKT